MTNKLVYVIKGTKYEPGEVYPELGEVKTRILGYATGDEDRIRKSYDGKGFMRIDVEPIEIERVFSKGNREVAA